MELRTDRSMATCSTSRNTHIPLSAGEEKEQYMMLKLCLERDLNWYPEIIKYNQKRRQLRVLVSKFYGTQFTGFGGWCRVRSQSVLHLYPLIDMLLDENPVEIVPHKLHLTGYIPTGYLYAPGQATPRTIMMTTGIVQVRGWHGSSGGYYSWPL